MTVKILTGDCRDVLKTLPDRSIQLCVTSPPYFNQRDYKVAGQIGLEKTPDEYVLELVSLFREVRRTLKDDGLLFLNLGDSYARAGGSDKAASRSARCGGTITNIESRGDRSQAIPPNLKEKDLIGIPWMVAFALRSDGWWLRADNVWGKPNGMPESTTDRTTRAHEYVFMLSKSARYFYDHEAVRTAPKATTQTQLAKPYLGESTKDHAVNGVQNASDIKRRIVEKARKPPSPKYVDADGQNNADIKARYYDKQRGHSRRHDGFNDRWDAMENSEQMAEGGNLRSVWWISPAQSKDAHFAVMPDALAEICIRAGSREGDTILDPFGGAGTTALVADRLGRNAVSIELNPDYITIQRKRIEDDAGLFAQVTQVAAE
jgi:DNA modification methylase